MSWFNVQRVKTRPAVSLGLLGSSKLVGEFKRRFCLYTRFISEVTELITTNVLLLNALGLTLRFCGYSPANPSLVIA